MYPNLFLNTFWRSEFRPQVFVAMQFDDTHKNRFDEVIKPAINSITLNGTQLEPYRVDLSKSGDSILTDIIDGIAHSEMFLADVSTVGFDSKTGKPFRNSNVLYEVGLAVACRQAAEILLIRDDRDPFLFDVSTIPHKNIDFTNIQSARDELKEEIISRLKERNYINDTRIKIAISRLTPDEKIAIEAFSKYPLGCGFAFSKKGPNLLATTAMPRLLDKQLIKASAIGDDGRPAYEWTRLGFEISQKIGALLPKATWEKEEKTPEVLKPINELGQVWGRKHKNSS